MQTKRTLEWATRPAKNPKHTACDTIAAMRETLYKTYVEIRERGSAEYYQLSLETSEVDGIPNHFVVEKHGWWEQTSRNPAFNVVETLNSGFADRIDAERVYQACREHRASEGFIHSYGRNSSTGEENHLIIQVG